MRRFVTAALGLVLVPLLALMTPASAQADPGPYPGSSAYPTYNSHFYAAATIGHAAGYIPQGLVSWSRNDRLLISYYSEKGTSNRSLIEVVDRISRKHIKHVYILGGHVGAMAIKGGYLFVADTTGVRRYTLSKLAGAANGSYLGLDKFFPTHTASYVAVGGGDLWVGNTTHGWDDEGTMYRYDITGAGNLSAKPIASRKTPGKVAGVVFTGRYIIYSRSYGRGVESRISVYNTSTGNWAPRLSAPSMSEDITIADGFLYVNYESGASYYRNGEDGKGKAKNPITKLHYASVSWLTGRA